MSRTKFPTDVLVPWGNSVKKTGALFATLILGSLILASFLIELQTVEAQPPRISVPYTPNNEEPYSYGINIGSPANTTYISNSLLLNVTLRRPVSPNDYDFKILYSLNGGANVSVPLTVAFLTSPFQIALGVSLLRTL
jgi:hypothetical protein